MSQRDIVGIDILRMVAAISVMLFHFGFKAFAEDGGVVPQFLGRPAELPGFWMMGWWGWIGVQLFFVISGLVIAFSAKGIKTTAPRFLRSRFLRLVPAVLIAASFAFLVEITFFGMGVVSAARLWAATVVFFPLPPWIMGQFWTIGIEISFYLAVLCLIYFNMIHHLARFGIALIIVGGAYWILRTAGGGTDSFGRITQLLLFQHGTYFGIGILISNWASDQRSRLDVPFIVLGLALSALQIRLSTYWEVGQTGLFELWPVAFAIFVAFVGLVMLTLAVNTAMLQIVGRYRSWVRTAGLMTYPLYLLHNHIGKPVMVWSLKANVPDALAVVLASSAALILSFVVAVWLEPIVRHALGRWLPQRVVN